MSEIFPESPLTSLPAAVAAMGALPVPVSPKPQPVDVADQREQAEAWEGHVLGAWDGKFAMESGLDRAVLKLARMVKVDVAELERLQLRVDEVERAYTFDTAALKRRIAELEAPLATARTEAIADIGDWLDEVGEKGAAYLVRTVDIPAGTIAEPACPCPPADPPHQVGCVFDGVPASPLSERPVDGPSPPFPTVASLREVSSREEPHDSPLHHPYRVGHDLPATGGEHRG